MKCFIFLILISCNAFSQSTQLVSFEKYEHDVFPSYIIQKNALLLNNNVEISIVDVNKDKDFIDIYDRDLNNILNCDFLSIRNKKTNQISSIVLKDVTLIKFDDQYFRIDYFKKNLTLLLSELCFINKDSIDLINDSEIKVKTLKDLYTNSIINTKKLINKSNDYTLFIFWSTDCTTCLNDLLYVKKYYSEISKKKVTLIHISDESNHDNSLKFLEKHNIHGKFYECSESERKQWNFRGYPFTIIYKKDGTLVTHRFGTINDILNSKIKK